jgi:hypothetical protein
MFNAFVWGTLVIAAIGMIAAYSLSGNRELSAEILRFYWFRLSDIAVPMGVALGGMRVLVSFNLLRIVSEILLYHTKKEEEGIKIKLFPSILGMMIGIAGTYFLTNYLCFTLFKLSPPDPVVPWAITLLIYWGIATFLFTSRPLPTSPSGQHFTLMLCYIAIVFYAPLTALPKHADLRTHAAYCRSEPVGPHGRRETEAWREMCRWIQQNTPKTAKFWIPRDGQTFKWHAQRADIGTWKNIPQDAASIVEWQQSMNDLFKYKNAEGETMTDRLLTTLLNSKTEEEIVALQQHYGFEYILCAQSHEMPTHSILEKVHENDVYCLYRVVPSLAER